MFSSVKDENVVKPPQTPTIRNKRIFAGISSLLVAMPARNPIARLPSMFISKVPTGIDKKCTDKLRRDNRKRNMLPINPPKPMMSNCCIKKKLTPKGEYEI